MKQTDERASQAYFSDLVFGASGNTDAYTSVSQNLFLDGLGFRLWYCGVPGMMLLIEMPVPMRGCFSEIKDLQRASHAWRGEA